MIGGFNNGDFDLKSPITNIKLHQNKALYNKTRITDKITVLPTLQRLHFDASTHYYMYIFFLL